MVKINIESQDKHCLISVAGEVDASSSIELDNALQKASETNSSILIDLTELEYISSAGLGVFISYLEEFKIKGVKWALFGMKSKVKEVFDILGLQHLLVIKDTLKEGLDAI